MKIDKIGYACINMTLAKDKISTNRTLIKKTFETKGLPYVSKLIIDNVDDLIKILTWNEQNNIRNYRLSSEMFPWFSHYKLEKLNNFTIIKVLMSYAGHLVKKYNHKVSFHPGPFNCLASSSNAVVKKTVFEINQHSRLLDLMGLDTTQMYNVNVHIGGVYGDKMKTIKRFIKNFNKLSENTKKRLTLENDDSPNGYTVQDLYYVYEQTGIPIVFDTLHWYCNPGELSYKESFMLAYSTWGDIIPEIHHSSSKKLWEDKSKTIKTHADYIYDRVDTCGKDVYVSFESKMKELAIIKYKNDFLNKRKK